jgi:hypothetical protein
MTKYLVKAHTHGSQVRISIPVLLVKKLDWLGHKFFIVEETGREEVTVSKFKGGKDLS